MHQGVESISPGPYELRMGNACVVTIPKDVHILIPGTCDYVTLCGKRDFADVIRLRILRWEVILVGPT